MRKEIGRSCKVVNRRLDSSVELFEGGVGCTSILNNRSRGDLARISMFDLYRLVKTGIRLTYRTFLLGRCASSWRRPEGKYRQVEQPSCGLHTAVIGSPRRQDQVAEANAVGKKISVSWVLRRRNGPAAMGIGEWREL
mgnify:CR=1 FL=1